MQGDRETKEKDIKLCKEYISYLIVCDRRIQIKEMTFIVFFLKGLKFLKLLHPEIFKPDLGQEIIYLPVRIRLKRRRRPIS